MKNEGKIFEEDFKKSVPKECWIYRLRDSTDSWNGAKKLRFTQENICDYIMFDDYSSTLFLLELKTTKEKSLTFWDESFNSSSYNIRKSQIIGLTNASNHNLIAGFVINFRSYENKTFFISINNFNKFKDENDKKSINMNDVIKYGGIEIKSEIKRTRYLYDIKSFIRDVGGICNGQKRCND